MDSPQTLQPNTHHKGESRALTSFFRQPVIHANLIVWFTFLATLDVMFTTLALHMGGSEMNAVAEWVIARWDLAGMVVFKFSVVVWIVCAVHLIARLNDRAAQQLAEWAVALSCVPVAFTIVQMMAVVYILSDII
jgi:uncharacterized membrane protein